jgi:transposase
MINMIEKNGIISMHIHEHKSKREISRILGISRNTVGKYIQEYETNLKALKASESDHESRVHQQSLFGKPTYIRTKPNRSAFTDEMKVEFYHMIEQDKYRDELLGDNKQKLSAAKIYRELRKKGYEVSQSTVERAFRVYKETLPKEVYIKQTYDPGKRAEYDFHQVKVLIDGLKRTYHQVTIALPYSDVYWVKLYHDETRHTLIKSIIEFIEYMGGTFEEMVFDNLSPLVKHYVLRKRDKIYDEELIKLSTYYGFKITTCNARSGWEKGSVENGGKYVRKELFSLNYRFEDEAELMDYVATEQIKINHSKATRFEVEKASIKRLTVPRYIYANEGISIVNSYSLVSISNNHYSVPERYVGKAIKYVKTTDTIALYEGSKLICKHGLLSGRNEHSMSLSHYEKTLKRKPGAIPNSVLLKVSSEETRRYYETVCQEDPKAFLQHLYGHVESSGDDEMARILSNQIQGFNALIPEVSYGRD